MNNLNIKILHFSCKSICFCPVYGIIICSNKKGRRLIQSQRQNPVLYKKAGSKLHNLHGSQATCQRGLRGAMPLKIVFVATNTLLAKPLQMAVCSMRCRFYRTTVSLYLMTYWTL